MTVAAKHFDIPPRLILTVSVQMSISMTDSKLATHFDPSLTLLIRGV